MFLTLVPEEMHALQDIRAKEEIYNIFLGMALTSEMAVNNRSPSKAGVEQLMSNLSSTTSQGVVVQERQVIDMTI